MNRIKDQEAYSADQKHSSFHFQPPILNNAVLFPGRANSRVRDNSREPTHTWPEHDRVLPVSEEFQRPFPSRSPDCTATYTPVHTRNHSGFRGCGADSPRRVAENPVLHEMSLPAQKFQIPAPAFSGISHEEYPKPEKLHLQSFSRLEVCPLGMFPEDARLYKAS